MMNSRRWFGMLLAGTIVVSSSGCLSQYGGFILPLSYYPPIPLTAARIDRGFQLGGYGFASEYPLVWPMPVSPALTQEIEDKKEREATEGVPILGPIQGEFASVFCMDPPSDEMVYKTLPPIVHGLPFVYEVQRKNVRISTEKLADKIDECKIYPLAGPCQLHHCHFKCTVHYEETTTMGWPIPWTHTEKKQEVLYIDKDHLHRCGEPGSLASAGGPSTLGGY